MKVWNPKRLRELIKLRGFTRQHVAEECGITVGSLHQVLGGYSRPGLQLALNFAELLETTVEDVLGKDTQRSA
jgi:transcriptional regulator with XRE-family HTH domain